MIYKSDYELAVHIASKNLAKTIDEDILEDVIAEAQQPTFRLHISHYDLLPDEPDMEYQEIETQRTGIDIEKYDKTNPEHFVDEVRELVADGKDYKNSSTVGDIAGMMVSEAFFHHLGKVREKLVAGIKPSFWNIRLANMCVMHLRCGFESTPVKCNKDHIVKGYVADASSDGSQVRLLFEIPPIGYDHLKNQRYLTQYTCMWFDIPNGTPTDKTVPFTLPDFNYQTRQFKEPGLRG